MHVWLGRVLVSAGLIDGVLGLTLAGKGAGVIVAYCIVAGGVWIIWIVVLVCASKRPKSWKEQRNDITMEALVDERDGEGGRMLNGALRLWSIRARATIG